MGELVFLESNKKMPLMTLPVRATYVPLQMGGVLLSPGSGLTRDQLKKINIVTDIVAPNLFHCAGIKNACSVFPNAKRWAVQGAKETKPDVPWTDVLSEGKWPYQNELEVIPLMGIPDVNESVFFHKESKSLIVTDLCFNMDNVSGIGAWLILSLFGTYKKFAVSKYFIKFVRDKKAFEESLAKIFALQFDNIVVSHGANIVGSGKDKLLFALRDRGINPK